MLPSFINCISDDNGLVTGFGEREGARGRRGGTAPSGGVSPAGAGWGEGFGGESHITCPPTCGPGAAKGTHRVSHVAAEDGKCSARRVTGLGAHGKRSPTWDPATERPVHGEEPPGGGHPQP